MPRSSIWFFSFLVGLAIAFLLPQSTIPIITSSVASTLPKIWLSELPLISNLTSRTTGFLNLSSSTTTANGMPRTPVYFLSHGGPNLFEDFEHPAYAKLQAVGREITQDVKPKAVVVFSAHWQAERAAIEVNTATMQNLIYDYYGFPDHYYKVQYPNQGSPQLAGNVIAKLRIAGIAAEGVERGLDHGVFAPFLVAFDPVKNPLNVPLVQVSLFANEDPKKHYALGAAISSLRSEGVLIICSGMAVHNLRDLWASMGKPGALPYTYSFDEALKDAVEQAPEGRDAAMAELLKRPDARKAHPSFEHLLPVHVAAGAAGNDRGERLWTLPEGSMAWAQFRFGDIQAA